MSDILLDQQANPAAPAAGTGLLYFDTTTKLLTARTSVNPVTVGGVRNASVSTQAYTTAEIYLAGSALVIPSHLLVAGATCRWRVVLTKTAGTGVLVWKIYVGTNGTTSDATIVTFTQVSVPTSATDTAWVDIEWVVRTIGGAATSTAGLRLNHVLATTGFSQLGTNVQMVAGSTFNAGAASLIAGISFAHGTAGAGNIEVVTAELVNG